MPLKPSLSVAWWLVSQSHVHDTKADVTSAMARGYLARRNTGAADLIVRK